MKDPESRFAAMSGEARDVIIYTAADVNGEHSGCTGRGRRRLSHDHSLEDTLYVFISMVCDMTIPVCGDLWP
jgi:hypothetical protein